MRNFLIAPICVCAAVVSFAAPAGARNDGWTTFTYNRTPLIIGSGRYVDQARPAGHFTEIEVNGSATLDVRVGPRPSIVIRADDNILPYLRSEIRGRKLVLDSRQSYRTRQAPRVTVTVPSLDSVAVNGSGNGRIVGVDARKMSLTISGSGDIDVSGRAGVLDVAIYGSGDVDASRLQAARVEAGIYGSGDIRVATNGPIKAGIFGSGNVRYLGRPASIDFRRFGSGQVVAAR